MFALKCMTGMAGLLLGGAVFAQLPVVQVPFTQMPAGVAPSTRDRDVRIEFVVAMDGSIEDCVVKKSSKNPVLDAESCKILTERGRFAPKRDRSGKPMSTSTRFIVRYPAVSDEADDPDIDDGGAISFSAATWIIDSDYPTAAMRREEQGIVVYSLDISANGAPSNCRIVKSSKSALLDEATCRLALARSSFIAASDGKGGRRRTRYQNRVRWVLPNG